jgi:phage terminase small subunit
MTPEGFLNKRGLELFARFSLILEKKGNADEAYSYELSILCYEYVKYEEAVKLCEENGMINDYKTGPVMNGYAVLKNKAFDNTTKKSHLFGFTPKDFKSINDKVKKPETEKPKGLTALMNKKQA